MKSCELSDLFPKESLKYAKELAHLQDQLLRITNESFEETYKLFLESSFNHEQLARLITKFAALRYEKISLLADLYIKFATENESIIEMKSFLFDKFILNCQRFIICLATKGFITAQEIAEASRSLYNVGTDLSQYIPIIAYFAPEIELYYPQVIKSFEARIDQYLKKNVDDLLPSESQFLLGFEHYHENDWELLNDRRLNTYEPSSLPQIIKSDDIDTFLMILGTSHFHINQIIPHTVYTDTVYPFSDPTVIQFAAFHGAIKIFTYLLEKCKLDKTNPEGITLAQFAVAGGHREIISILRSKGVNFKHTLQAAASFYQNDIFIDLYYDHVQDLNDFDTTLDTVLNCCVSQSNMELVLFCLENGVNINQKGKFNYYPIHCAISYCKNDFISFILSHNKINVNVKEVTGQTPLFLAVQFGNSETVKLILDKSEIDLSIKDKYGRTPLHFAVENDDKETVKALLDSGKFDVNQTDRFHQTPMHIAARTGLYDIIDVLVQTGSADLTVEDLGGQTPIDVARRHGNMSVLHKLGLVSSSEDESSDPDTTEYEDEEEEEEEEESISDSDVDKEINDKSNDNEKETEKSDNNNKEIHEKSEDNEKETNEISNDDDTEIHEKSGDNNDREIHEQVV